MCYNTETSANKKRYYPGTNHQLPRLSDIPVHLISEWKMDLEESITCNVYHGQYVNVLYSSNEKHIHYPKSTVDWAQPYILWVKPHQIENISGS